MNYFDREARGLAVMRQLLAQHVFPAYQQNLDVMVPRRQNRTFDFRLGRTVRAHRVHCYGCHR